MSGPLTVGGQPLIVLETGSNGPGFTRAVIAPGRAMMLLTLEARLADGQVHSLVACPPLEEAARRLGDRSDAFPGNAAFAFGGAVLAPFANRITGRVAGDRIVADLVTGQVSLPANWSGKAAGAQRYAMHGLILDRAAERIATGAAHASGHVVLDDPAAWPSRLDFVIGWSLSAERLVLHVEAINEGRERTPVGIGWHPYFTLPSGRRAQARLSIPAASRAVVGDYDAVLPTGEVEGVDGTAYDFRAAVGRALGEQYLDDCFLDLDTRKSHALARLIDPAADYSLTVSAQAPPVRAFQVYAPPGEAFVALEPQFNLADPFNPALSGRDTGMVVLEPGETTSYVVALTLGGS